MHQKGVAFGTVQPIWRDFIGILHFPYRWKIQGKSASALFVTFEMAQRQNNHPLLRYQTGLIHLMYCAVQAYLCFQSKWFQPRPKDKTNQVH